MNSLVVMILISAPLFVALVIAFLAGRFFSRAARSFFSSTAESSQFEAANIARSGKGRTGIVDANVPGTGMLPHSNLSRAL